MNCQPFAKLSVHDLYQIIQLRMECFVVEQKACYQDLDGIDQQAQHFTHYQGEQLLGYLRLHGIEKDNHSYKISRICVDQAHRHQTIGTQLINAAIGKAKKLQAHSIQITAQKHLHDYYEYFGFSATFESFDINQIAHQTMQLKLNH